jgi:hypothetical protein
VANQFVVSTGSVTLVAATAKTCIEFPTSATTPIVVTCLEVMSAASAAGSVVVEWISYLTSGTGTTVTPQKWGPDQSIAAIMGTVKVANSVEPGTISVLQPNWVIPLPGMYSIIYPFGREMYQPVSALRGLRVTSTIASPVRINLYFEH